MLLNRDKNGGIYFQAWKNLLENTPKGFWLYNQNIQEYPRYSGLAERMEKRDKVQSSGNFLLEPPTLSSNVVNHGAVNTNLEKCNQLIPWKDARNQKSDSQNETKFHSTPSTMLAKHSQPYLLTEGKKCFQCPQCKYATDRKNNLKRHLGTMHRDCGKLLQCCDSIFSSKAALRDHIFAVHKAGYRCQHCGRSFCRKALLKRHEIGHDAEDESGNRSTFRKQIFQSDTLTLRGYNDFSSNLSSPVEQTSMAFQIQKIPNLSCTSSMRADMNRKENVFYQTVNIFQHLEQQFLIKNRQVAHTEGLSNSQNYQTISNYNFFKTETSDSHDSDIQLRSDPLLSRDFDDKVSKILPKKHRKLFLSRRLLKVDNNTFIDEESLKEIPKCGEQTKTNGRLLLGDNRRLCRNVYRCSVCKCEFDNQMKLVKHHHK